MIRDLEKHRATGGELNELSPRRSPGHVGGGEPSGDGRRPDVVVLGQLGDRRTGHVPLGEVLGEGRPGEKPKPAGVGYEGSPPGTGSSCGAGERRLGGESCRDLLSGEVVGPVGAHPGRHAPATEPGMDAGRGDSGRLGEVAKSLPGLVPPN